MKKIAQSVFLGTLLCGGLGVANAGLLITPQSDIQEFTCVLPDQVPVERSISFVIENNTRFQFTDLMLALLRDHADPTYRILALEKVNCGHVVNDILAAVSLAPGQLCEGRLRLSPPECPLIGENVYGFISGEVQRTLALNHPLNERAPITLKASPLGAAAAFAVLSPELSNDDGYGPVEVMYGDVGSLATQGTFHVANGTLYPDEDPATVAALQDLKSAYQILISQSSECLSPEYDLSDAVLFPGTYCLDGHAVVNQQKLILSGEGQYVFHISGEGFYLGPNASVILTEGASANDVYWVVENRLHVSQGAYMVGNILGGESIDYEIFAGKRSHLLGRVLSQDALALYGHMVRLP